MHKTKNLLCPPRLRPPLLPGLVDGVELSGQGLAALVEAGGALVAGHGNQEALREITGTTRVRDGRKFSLSNFTVQRIDMSKGLYSFRYFLTTETVFVRLRILKCCSNTQNRPI